MEKQRGSLKDVQTRQVKFFGKKFNRKKLLLNYEAFNNTIDKHINFTTKKLEHGYRYN